MQCYEMVNVVLSKKIPSAYVNVLPSKMCQIRYLARELKIKLDIKNCFINEDCSKFTIRTLKMCSLHNIKLRTNCQ